MNGFPVTVRFPLHWGEMDALGHANNARFFTWFESARIAYFTRVGLLADQPRPLGPILATASCDFLRPLVYPADLVVGARVTRVGNTSFQMAYAVARAEAEDAPCATGTAVVVLVDYTTMLKVPVPAEVRAAIAALEGPGLTAG